MIRIGAISIKSKIKISSVILSKLLKIYVHFFNVPWQCDKLVYHFGLIPVLST